jgi:hypothetical protein
MIALLSEIGKKIADRWLTALLLPGLLFIAALVCAWLLGHRHALDLGELIRQISSRIAPLEKKPVQIAVVIVLVLLAATVSAHLAQALTGAVNMMWTSKRPQRIISYRRRRAMKRRPNQPGPYLPARLTPAGDHWRLAGARIATHYGLDLNRIWPRVWLMIPAESRTIVQASYGAYHSALTLTAWGLLYLVVGCWWWPAAVAGAVATAIGHRRGAVTAATTAELLEALTDLHVKALVTALDAAQERVVTDTEALRINNVLGKRQQF